MPIFVADEVVTAAKMNKIYKPVTSVATSNRTFTNTSFLDLDALTGGAGSLTAVIVTVTTEATALVMINAERIFNTAGITILSYRISGATTLAAADTLRTVMTQNTLATPGAGLILQTGLTPGSNVFELQARVNAGTGSLFVPSLIVVPI